MSLNYFQIIGVVCKFAVKCIKPHYNKYSIFFNINSNNNPFAVSIRLDTVSDLERVLYAKGRTSFKSRILR